MKDRGNRSISLVWKVLFVLCFTIVVVLFFTRFGNTNENKAIQKTKVGGEYLNIEIPRKETDDQDKVIGENLNIEIPRREKDDQYVSLTDLQTWTQINISKFPDILKFFTYFTFDLEKSNIPPWIDLEDFLKNLRQTGRNMFVAPIGQVYHHNENKVVVKVNIVWESAGPCRTGVDGICVYGALGDIGYIDFKLDNEKKVLDWKFKHIMDPPNYRPYVQQQEPRLNDAREFNLNGLPTLYLDCSYSGRYIYLNQGWFDLVWLKFWNLSQIAVNENGMESFSSIDATGCWSVSLWLEEGWKGGNVIINNQREACFFQTLGFMNDRAKSVSCFNLCSDKLIPEKIN